jgi:hypothetical protein
MRVTPEQPRDILHEGDVLSSQHRETSVRRIPRVLGLSFTMVLFSAAIVANVGGGHMPEMRGAWIAQALR